MLKNAHVKIFMSPSYKVAAIDMKFARRSKIYRFPKKALLASMLIFGFGLISVSVSPAQDDTSEKEEEFTQTKTAQDEWIKLFNQGQDAHAKGELKEALDLYERALRSNRAFPEAEYQRGAILKELGNIGEAEKAFNRAITLNPEWTLPHFELGLLYSESGKYSQAEKLFTTAISFDNNNFDAFVALSDVLNMSNASKPRLENLLIELQRLTNSTNAPVSIWTSKSSIERKLGDFDSARISASKALQISEKDIIALSELTEVYIALEENEKAIESANKLISIVPNSKTAKILLARAFDSNNDSKKAIAVLESIKSQDDEVIGLIKILKANGDLDIAALEKMIETDASNVTALGRLCIAARTTAPTKALEYCQRALILDPENITHAIGYGAALVQLRRYQESTAVLTNLLRHSPDNYTIHANLATALFQMQNFEAAKAEYSWIIEKQPEMPIAYYFLAISYDRLQEYAEALESYQKFLKLANVDDSKLEIEKVNLRIPILENQIKRGLGRKTKGG